MSFCLCFLAFRLLAGRQAICAQLLKRLQKMTECSYRNPVSGDDCQLTSVHQGNRILSHAGQDYCWWHLPLPDDDKASAGVDPHMYKRLLGRYARSSAIARQPIDFSGIHFSASPLEFIPVHDLEGLILRDVNIYGNFSLSNQYKLNSIELTSAVIDGSLSLGTPLPTGAALHNCRIKGSLAISYLVAGSVCVSNTVLRGNLSIGGHARETLTGLTLGRCVIGGGIDVPDTITLQELRLAESHIRKSVKVHARHGAIILTADKVVVRGTTDLHSERQSTFEASSSRFTGGVLLYGQWKSILVRSQSRIRKLDFRNAKVEHWKCEESSLDTCIDGSGNGVFNIAEIVDCEFTNDATFRCSEFGEFYCRAVFRESLEFVNTRFSNDLHVDDGSFVETLDLSCSESVPNFQSAARLPTCTFDGVKIGLAFFNGRRFAGPVSFAGAIFKQAPSFYGSKFEESFVFPMKVSAYGTSSPHDEAKYRHLRQVMEALRARAYEGLFFALEQKSAFKYLDSTADKIASWVYGGTSMYGTQLSRALLSFLLVFITFACWYNVGLMVGTSAELTQEVSTAVRLSLQQTFLPFFGLRAEGWGIGWYLAWVGQSALSLAIIAEILVIIRWRFRRG